MRNTSCPPVFARGLAAAVIAQEILVNNLPYAQLVVNVTYSVIVFTIILSSVNVFMTKRMFDGKDDSGKDVAQKETVDSEHQLTE